MICKRFALVGSGFIGQVHATSLARHEGSALTMVADAAPERAQALAARYGARAVTVSEAIHSDAIDAVLIASSTPSHAELLEAAARAGKAVYCEKPIDLSLARAREVVERVLPLNVPVTVGFNRRFDSSHQQLRRQLEQGLIGRVELVQMVCRASTMPPLDYLRSSGGQMRDQAIHFFDLLRFLTGDEVRTVAAMGAGGISGAPVADRSRQVLARIHERAGDRIVIISVGGVETPEDVWDRITHGAHLVQTYTGFVFTGPGLIRGTNKLVARRLRQGGFASLAEAVGSAVS